MTERAPQQLKGRREERPDRQRRRPVVSAILDGDILVETLFEPAPPASRFLVSFAEGEHVEMQKVPAPGPSWLVPYSPDNNLLTHRVVLLPSALGKYASENALLAGIRRFIHRHVDLSPSFEEIAALYVLLTWVYDRFSELPYLRVLGEYGSGKSRFLLTVGSLCYKPLFASGASSVSPLFRLIDAVGGTLVIDEADFRASDERSEIVKILNNGHAKGFPVLRSEATPTNEYNPRAFTVFGPKLVATRHRFDDRALESRCITERLGGRPLRPDIPLNLPEGFDEEARQLRNRLLSYRLRTFRRPLPIVEAPRTLEPRVAQVFSPLAAVALSEPARARVWKIAEGHSREVRLDRAVALEAEVVETIQTLRREGRELTVKAIAEAYAARFGDGAGAATPRWMGSVLRRRLGIHPVKRHGTYVIPVEAFPSLDQLSSWYRVDDGDVGDIVGEAA